MVRSVINIFQGCPTIQGTRSNQPKVCNKLNKPKSLQNHECMRHSATSCYFKGVFLSMQGHDRCHLQCVFFGGRSKPLPVYRLVQGSARFGHITRTLLGCVVACIGVSMLWMAVVVCQVLRVGFPLGLIVHWSVEVLDLLQEVEGRRSLVGHSCRPIR
jgi:hypothetical protein